MKAGLIDGGWMIESALDFNGIGELWNLPAKSLQQLRQATQLHLAGNAPEAEVAAVDFFARVYLNDLTPWPDHILRAFDAWCLQETQNPFSMFAAAKISPAVTLQVLTQRYRYNPKSMGRCLTVAQSLPPESCAEFFRMCALNPDPDLRQYFFEVVSNFHRLVVPKSLTPYCSEDVMLEILHQSLQDPVASVRERAIVYAYGLGWIDRMVSRIIELTRDESQDVRQYALVALGIATEDASMQILLKTIERGSKPEMQSAIWALARREGGLERLLPMLNNDRSWVIDDVLGAIKWVSLPLTDQQIAYVKQRVESPSEKEMLPSIIGHHLWRTRDPQGKEFPPDRRITYAFSPEPP